MMFDSYLAIYKGGSTIKCGDLGLSGFKLCFNVQEPNSILEYFKFEK